MDTDVYKHTNNLQTKIGKLQPESLSKLLPILISQVLKSGHPCSPEMAVGSWLLVSQISGVAKTKVFITWTFSIKKKKDFCYVPISHGIGYINTIK